jgi:hypothetical protein
MEGTGRVSLLGTLHAVAALSANETETAGSRPAVTSDLTVHFARDRQLICRRLHAIA